MQKSSFNEPWDALKTIQNIEEINLNLSDVYQRFNTKRVQEKRVHTSFLVLFCVSVGMQAFLLSSPKKSQVKEVESGSNISLNLY